MLTIPGSLEPGTSYTLRLNSIDNMVIDEQGNLLAPTLVRFTTKTT